MDQDRKPESPAGCKGSVVGAYTRRGLHGQSQIQVNLERVLLLASQDEAFKTDLLDNVDRALACRDICMTPTELAVLASMPRAVLETTITGLRPHRQIGRPFAKQVAAAVTGTILIGTSAYCCGGVDGEDYHPDASADGAVDGDSDGGTADGGTKSDQ